MTVCAHCGEPVAWVGAAGSGGRWVHLSRTPIGPGRLRPAFVTCPGLRTTIAAPVRRKVA